MATRAKRFEYAVAMDADGGLTAEGKARIDPGEEWKPDHLLLGGLLRCSMASLRFHAARAGATVTGAGRVDGLVTRRDEDGRFGLVTVDVVFDVAVTPPPESAEAMRTLIAKAERDCFVAASLRVDPNYTWTVNGRVVDRPASS